MRTWLALAALLPLSAFATVPPLTGNGATSGNAAAGVFTANIGSPVAGELVVLIVACNDIGTDDSLTIQPPSGWTREMHRESADTFASHGVLWKIATGSEGATLAVTISGLFPSNSQCGSWYFKYTGFDSANPVDVADTIWDFLSTQDPPNLAVANAPKDVDVIAFASSRGEEAYVSGSNLGTNAHLDGGGIATGRSVAVSYGSFAALSSKDPGAFVIGSADRLGSALTIVVNPSNSSGLPTPPTGTHWVTLNSIATGSPVDLFNATASPDIVAGDSEAVPLVTTPGGYTLTASVDGNFSYNGGTDQSRQYASIQFYDLSAGALHADTLVWYNHNTAPTPAYPAGSVVYKVPRNSAMTPVNLASPPLCYDDDADALTYTAVTSLPTGLAIANNVLSGTATTKSITTVTFRCTDVAGESSDFQ